MPGDARFVGFVANKGAGAALPALDSPPQHAEDFMQLWKMILAMSKSKLQGKEIKVGMGIRRWVWALDDPRAAC